MTPGITVAIPTIPPRRELLQRAVASVLSQTLQPAALSITVDHDRQGAPATRQRALKAVQTDLVAFLDDDDEFLPQHLEKLNAHLIETNADLVFSWFEVVGGRDPFPIEFSHRQWDNDTWQQHTTITVLVRTELAQEVGFYAPRGLDNVLYSNEDWAFIQGCLKRGAKISRISERTWKWHHDSGNTSGLPCNW